MFDIHIDLRRIVFGRYKSLNVLSLMSSLFYDTNDEGLRNTASAPYNPVFSCVITLLICLPNPHTDTLNPTAVILLRFVM